MQGEDNQKSFVQHFTKKKTHRTHVVLLWLLCGRQAKVRQQCMKHETNKKKRWLFLEI